MPLREHLKANGTFSNYELFLQTIDTFVNIAYDELCFRVRGEELNCKSYVYFLYIFSILSFDRSSVPLLFLQLMK